MKAKQLAASVVSGCNAPTLLHGGTITPQWPVAELLERDDLSSNRHPDLFFCLS